MTTTLICNHSEVQYLIVWRGRGWGGEGLSRWGEALGRRRLRATATRATYFSSQTSFCCCKASQLHLCCSNMVSNLTHPETTLTPNWQQDSIFKLTEVSTTQQPPSEEHLVVNLCTNLSAASCTKLELLRLGPLDCRCCVIVDLLYIRAGAREELKESIKRD